MAKYINLDKLLEKIEDERPINWTDSEYEDGEQTCFEYMLEVIKEQPTADVVEVRHSKWLTWEEQFHNRKPSKNKSLGVFCNNCRNHSDNITDYCPNCGAKMDGKVGDNNA